MSRVVEYTDWYQFLDSTALSQGCYNSRTKDLFLELRNGFTIVGYREVPEYVWDELISSTSAGNYWTKQIKPYFTGQSGDVDFRAADTAPVVNTPSLQKFTVEADLSGTIQLVVEAIDANSAIEEFKKAFQDQPNLTVKERSVTFD